MRFDTLSAVLPRPRKLGDCHVIVCGNEKGGSGKSTIAMHVATSLLKLGFKVATVDLDTRQQTFSRFSNYRRRWMQNAAVEIECADHYTLHHEAALLYEISTDETCGVFDAILSGWRRAYDFIVIDTPGSFTMLSTAAHRQADTLITPINDSFLDFDVLANVDPLTLEVESIAQYAASVRDSRRIREAQSTSGARGILDWIVVRNRMSNISSRNERRVDECLRMLSMRLGFRVAHGIAERVVYRESFIRGLTALDETAEYEKRIKIISIPFVCAQRSACAGRCLAIAHR
ncbi:MAG: division plane positioning ATPase MipZ [Ahrensia sp.]|nr:division plane positioning ATPase MipZ [Ahrensia sp.]